MQTIYFDNNASTGLTPEVLEAMIPYYIEHYGNPSSLHQMGLAAEHALKTARATLTQIVGASDVELIFTSGGTESINLALKGMAHACQRKGRHIITVPTEHMAVLSSLKSLQQEGFEISYAKSDASGVISTESITSLIKPETILVALAHVNNEVGTIQPIESVAAAVKSVNASIRVFSDGAQSFGKINMSLQNIDAYAISGHKFHAPKGVGALFLKKGTPCKAILSGGGQESDLRSGTENVASIVGLAKAAELAYATLSKNQAHFLDLRKYFLNELQTFQGVEINSSEAGLPNTVNVSFLGIPSEVMLNSLDAKGICVSAGSACSAHRRSPSHVLKALGLSDARVRSAVRFSFSRYNTLDEVDRTIKILREIVMHLTAVHCK